MQFYNSTTKDGICQEIDRLCDTTDTTYTRLDKTSRVNNALEEVISWLLNADGTWQFDDDNYTTTPSGNATLVSGQITYSFADKLLDILEVDVLDTNGYYKKIKAFDPSEVGVSFEEYFNITYDGSTYTASTGFPDYYDKVGNTIRLSNSPTSANVTLTKGLKVRFKRTASLFTPASDTSADTQVPGFASPFHSILAYMASLPYCATYKKDRVGLYDKKVQDIKREMLKFYGKREKDKRKVMTFIPVNHR